MTARIKVKWLSIQRKTIDPLDMPDGDLELWSIPDFDNGSPSITNRQSIGSSKKVVFPGDVLLSKIVPHIRRAWIVRESNLPQYASTEWLTFHSSKVRPEFLRYALLTDEFNRQMQLNSNGMGSLKRADPEKVGEQQINLPTIRKQKIIADFLDKRLVAIDAVIHQKSEQLKKISSYRQSLITRAVTKGLDPNVEMKDSGVEWIGKIPKHWQVCKIKYAGDSFNGLTYSLNDLLSDGIPVLRSCNIQNAALDLSDTVFVSKDIARSAMLEEGDVLICSRNGSAKLIGKCAYISQSEKYAFGAFMMVYRSGLKKFGYYVLNSALFGYYKPLFSTTTINQLTSGTFGDFLIPLPPEAERVEISNALDKELRKIDSLSENLNQAILKIKEYRSSLISAAVTGQLAIEDKEATA